MLTVFVAIRAAWGRDERRGAWAGDGDQGGRLRVGVWGDHERQHMARHAHLPSEPALSPSIHSLPLAALPLQSFSQRKP